MKNSSFSRTVQHAGMIAVIAGSIIFAGCQRSPETPATAPSPAPMANTAPVHPMEAPVVKQSNVPAMASLKVTVSLSPALASKAAPDDVVFIFARATQGPRMPLAVVSKHVKDLPVTVVLDDNLAMNPEMKLSSVPKIVVVARVSKSGMANARDGDLEGASLPVMSGTKAVSITIDKVLTGQNASGSPHG